MSRYVVTFDDLVAIARRIGVTVVRAPSSHRGQIGEMGTVVGTTCHYTGTANSYRPELEYPDYNVVKEGRAGLDNSLSAWGLGRYTTIFVFSEDISWHAGTWYWKGITDGNGHFLGVEAAGVGDWTPWQRRVYPRLIASALLFIDAPADASMAPTHAQGAVPHGRKVDFLNTDSGWLPDVPEAPHSFHGSVRWLMANPAYININFRPTDEGFLMALTDDQQKKIYEVLTDKNINGKTLSTAVRDLEDRVVSKKYDRMTPDDPADDQTLPGTIRYMDARLTRVEDGLTEALMLLRQLVPPAPPV